MSRSRGLLCLLLCLSAPPTTADELLFKNGDRLTGRVIALGEGKLRFASTMAGEVEIKLSELRTFSTVDPIEKR